LEDQSGAFLAAEAGQRPPAAGGAPQRDVPCPNGHYGASPSGVRRCNYSLVIVGGQISQKTPDASKRLPSSPNDGAASRYLPLSA
jgi:hypothetical protein